MAIWALMLSSLLFMMRVFSKFPNEVILVDELARPMNFIDQAGGCLPVAPLHNATKIGTEAFVTDFVKARNGIIYFVDRLLWQPYPDVACQAG